jgi:hypothetical protein
VKESNQKRNSGARRQNTASEDEGDGTSQSCLLLTGPAPLATGFGSRYLASERYPVELRATGQSLIASASRKGGSPEPL